MRKDVIPITVTLSALEMACLKARRKIEDAPRLYRIYKKNVLKYFCNGRVFATVVERNGKKKFVLCVQSLDQKEAAKLARQALIEMFSSVPVQPLDESDWTDGLDFDAIFPEPLEPNQDASNNA